MERTPQRQSARLLNKSPKSQARRDEGADDTENDHTIASLGSLRHMDLSRRTMSFGGANDDNRRETLASLCDIRNLLAESATPASVGGGPSMLRKSNLKSAVKSSSRKSVTFGSMRGVLFETTEPVTNRTTPLPVQRAKINDDDNDGEQDDASTRRNSLVLQAFDGTSAKTRGRASMGSTRRKQPKMEAVMEDPTTASEDGPLGLSDIVRGAEMSPRGIFWGDSKESPSVPHLGDVMRGPGEDEASPTVGLPPRMSELGRLLESNEEEDSAAPTATSPTMDLPPRFSEIGRMGPSESSPTGAIPRMSEIVRIGGVEDEDDNDDDKASVRSRRATLANVPTMGQICLGADDEDVPLVSGGSSPTQEFPPAMRHLVVESPIELVHHNEPVMVEPAPPRKLVAVAPIAKPAVAEKSKPAVRVPTVKPVIAEKSKPRDVPFTIKPLHPAAAPIAPPPPVQERVPTIGECLEKHLPEPAVVALQEERLQLSAMALQQPSGDDVFRASSRLTWGRTWAFIWAELDKISASHKAMLDAETLALPWTTTTCEDERVPVKLLADLAQREAKAELEQWMAARVLEQTGSALDKTRSLLEDDVGTLREWTRQADDACEVARTQLDDEAANADRARQMMSLTREQADLEETLASLCRQEQLAAAELAELHEQIKRLRVLDEQVDMASLEQLESQVDLALVNLSIHQGLASWRLSAVGTDSVRVCTQAACDLTVHFGLDGRIVRVDVNNDPNSKVAREALDALVGRSVASAGLLFDSL